MTRTLAAIVVIILCGVQTWAHADDEAVQNANGEDVDSIITNNKMRAETGAKARYSMASSLTYAAGPINSPFGLSRPNLSGATGSTDYTSLSGDVSFKYNFDVQNSIFGGVGLRWITPTEGAALPPGFNGNKFDADNPYVNYQYLYRWMDIQSALVLNEVFYTNVNLTRKGFVTAWNLSQDNVYDIGSTGLSVGISVYGGVGYFNDNSPSAKRFQSDYDFGVIPAVEYKLTPKLNLRTDSNPWSFQHMRTASRKNTYQHQTWTQNFALGWSITRDLFLYPGFAWIDENISVKRTVTWVTMDLNLF